jgi:ABC-type sugar transport system permease subunit
MPRNWLGETDTAMFAVVMSQAWSTLGVSGLIYLAGLSSIPEELYEESELAGAGLLDRFLAVTWPHIKPLAGIGLVGWFVSAARATEHVFLMTGGGPGGATYIVGLDIFTQAYVNIRFGYAMAEVWLMAAVILAFSIYQMRAVRRGQISLLEG